VERAAAIAAVHDRVPRAEDTDWPQILGLYSLLPDTPVVTLNRAVAVAMVDGPAAGLALLDGLDDGPLAGHYRVRAVRGHLYEMAGDTARAHACYRAAAAGTTSIPEQRYLTQKAAGSRKF
jgi:predicted RNA polymerase sigma factor